MTARDAALEALQRLPRAPYRSTAVLRAAEAHTGRTWNTRYFAAQLRALSDTGQLVRLAGPRYALPRT